MEIRDILIRFGLEQTEIKIYLYLLRSNRSTIAEIARETDLYRPTVYRLLPILIKKKLVAKIRFGKRTMYIAEDPKVFETLADQLKDELKENLPELKRVYESSRKKITIRVFEGKEGIKHVYEDMVRVSKKGDATYRYESPKDYKTLARYYPELYWRRATGPNGEIEKYVITNEATHKRRGARLNRHSKAIPTDYDFFDYDITQLIYKNKVAFIDFEAETATLIEDVRFADFQRKLFQLLFGKL